MRVSWGGWRAFDYSLARPRILYARRAPRLVCADVTDGADQIAALQAQLRDAFIQRFPKFQLRAQSPHVTLARFKRNAHPQTATPVSEALAELPSSALPRSDRLVSIQLVESDLTPSGPVYRRLAEATP
jgi:2'-5' RNA ligase